jgi:hypothetical protein
MAAPDYDNLRNGLEWRLIVWGQGRDRADASGVADETWAKIADGKTVRPDAMRRAAQYLHWPVDFQKQLLAGQPHRSIPSVVYGPVRRWEAEILEWLDAPERTFTDEELAAKEAKLEERPDDIVPWPPEDDPPPGGAAAGLPKPSEDPDLRLAAAGGRLAQMPEEKRRLVLDLIDQLAEE